MLSRELPSALSLAKRQELATRMWNCWSKKEKKSIVLALESSPVDKTQAGTATVNADRPTLEEQRIDNPMPDLECWVDTSVVPHYATILIHKHFMVFRFTQTPNSKGSQGEWEETVALELAARAAIALSYSGSSIRVYSQSRPAIQNFEGVEGKVETMNESVARLRYLLGESRTKMMCVEVSPEANQARTFSRGMLGIGYTKMPCKIQLPVILMPLIDVIV
ncbi:hypothetical protein FS749_009766 [Ceratobasidium sp. UAMH 11750]|nr:hypothetical protein FS749_009766 [Ceratobasidium sp. UAMH 11750]